MKRRGSLASALTGTIFPTDVAVGVGWYKPADWAIVKANAVDPDRFEDSFAEWEKMASDSFGAIRKCAPSAVKVLISANELLAWCLAEGRINDASARSAFVNVLMDKRLATANPA